MKDCERYQELISRMADEELTNGERADLSAHMEQCSECNAMYAVFTQLSEIISEDVEDLPEGLHENIMAGIRRHASVCRNRARFKMSRPLRNVFAAAACVAFIIIASRGISPKSKSESVVIRNEAIQTAAAIETAQLTPLPTIAPTPRISPFQAQATPEAEQRPEYTVPAQGIDIYDGSHAESTYTQPVQTANPSIQQQQRYVYPEHTVDAHSVQDDTWQQSIAPSSEITPSATVKATPAQQEIEASAEPSEAPVIQSEASPSIEDNSAEAQSAPQSSSDVENSEEQEESGKKRKSIFGFSFFNAAEPEEYLAEVQESSDAENTEEAEADSKHNKLTVADNEPESTAPAVIPTVAPTEEVLQTVAISISDASTLDGIIKLLSSTSSPAPSGDVAPSAPVETAHVHESSMPKPVVIYQISFAGDALQYYNSAELEFFGDSVMATFHKAGAKDVQFVSTCTVDSLESLIASMPSPSPSADIKSDVDSDDD